MTHLDEQSSTNKPVRPNGSGAAALLAAATGCFSLAVLSLAADKSGPIRSSMIWYKPTGPLSGVTTLALLIWFVLWGVLELRWGKKNVALKPVCVISLALLALGFLLTFPPLTDAF